MILADTSNGQVRVQGNELIVDSKDVGGQDAAKVRVGSKNGGAYSFDVITEAAEGNHRDEAIVLTGGVNPDGGAELGFNLWDGVRPISDAGQKKVAEFRHNEVEFKVPVKGVVELRSPGGRYRTIMQDDGNLVTYDLADGHAIWSSLTGWIG